MTIRDLTNAKQAERHHGCPTLHGVAVTAEIENNTSSFSPVSIANQTKPTGFSSLPPSGPAIPVVETA